MVLLSIYLSNRHSFIMSNPTHRLPQEGTCAFVFFAHIHSCGSICCVKGGGQENLEFGNFVWWFKSAKQHSKNLVQNNWKRLQFRRQKQSLS